MQDCTNCRAAACLLHNFASFAFLRRDPLQGSADLLGSCKLHTTAEHLPPVQLHEDAFPVARPAGLRWAVA